MAIQGPLGSQSGSDDARRSPTTIVGLGEWGGTNPWIYLYICTDATAAFAPSAVELDGQAFTLLRQTSQVVDGTQILQLWGLIPNPNPVEGDLVITNSLSKPFSWAIGQYIGVDQDFPSGNIQNESLGPSVMLESMDIGNNPGAMVIAGLGISGGSVTVDEDNIAQVTLFPPITDQSGINLLGAYHQAANETFWWELSTARKGLLIWAELLESGTTKVSEGADIVGEGEVSATGTVDPSIIRANITGAGVLSTPPIQTTHDAVGDLIGAGTILVSGTVKPLLQLAESDPLASGRVPPVPGSE